MSSGREQVPEPLHVRKFSVKYPDFFLSADFTVLPGERLALVGKSGCGKTTLLRWIAGFDLGNTQQELNGSLWMGNSELTRISPEKRSFGWVSQEPALFPSLNVIDNVAFGLRVRGMSRDERYEKARQALNQVGLLSKKDSPSHALSGGEKQRVAFLRAILWKPRALLLDEPFSALDPSTRKDVTDALVDIHRVWPVPLILVTHDRDDVISVATRQIHARVGEYAHHTEFMQGVS